MRTYEDLLHAHSRGQVISLADVRETMTMHETAAYEWFITTGASELGAQLATELYMVAIETILREAGLPTT